MSRPTQPDRDLILASGSPRRGQLLTEAGYRFTVQAPDASVEEGGIRTGISSADLVAQLAKRKAHHVAKRTEKGMILAADTVADIDGQVLGKPRDREHARQMLSMLSGKRHAVYTGVCLWLMPESRCLVDVSRTILNMQQLDGAQMDAYLDTDLWQGKAGAFGYQDGNDWLEIVEGSESNVVGLPMERLRELLADFERLAEPVL